MKDKGEKVIKKERKDGICNIRKLDKKCALDSFFLLCLNHSLSFLSSNFNNQQPDLSLNPHCDSLRHETDSLAAQILNELILECYYSIDIISITGDHLADHFLDVTFKV